MDHHDHGNKLEAKTFLIKKLQFYISFNKFHLMSLANAYKTHMETTLIKKYI